MKRKQEELGIGLMVRFGQPPEESFRSLRSYGLHECQFAAVSDEYLYGKEWKSRTDRLKELMDEYEIAATSTFAGFPDQDWKNWRTEVGVTPAKHRAQRLIRSCRASDWSAYMGISQIAMHVGLIPEDRDSEDYKGFIRSMAEYTRFLESNGQFLCYETGMESVEQLKQTMEDVGTGNQRLNFDTGNLLIYNASTPLAYLEAFGDKVMHIHCKDAVKPVPGETRGKEVRLGEGETCFKEVFRKLYQMGYRGPLTIEREASSGDANRKDIQDAVLFLEELKKSLRG